MSKNLSKKTNLDGNFYRAVAQQPLTSLAGALTCRGLNSPLIHQLTTRIIMSTKACTPSLASNSNGLNSGSIYAGVQDHYGSTAMDQTKDNQYGHAVASAFGYSEQELLDAPAESNLGLSCGNPFAMANLQEGETVIDLGSGAGFDVFQAAKKVGSSGRAIGVDMNDVCTQVVLLRIPLAQADNKTKGHARPCQFHQGKDACRQYNLYQIAHHTDRTTRQSS